MAIEPAEGSVCAPYGGEEIPCYAVLLGRNPIVDKQHNDTRVLPEEN